MIPSSSVLELVRATARQMGAPGETETEESHAQAWSLAIAQVTAHTGTDPCLADTLSTLCRESSELLDRDPRLALALARLTFALAQARGDPQARGETALTYAIALNRLGEFRDALAISRQAALSFSETGDVEQAGRGLCEAAWANSFIGDLDQVQQDVARVRASQPSPLLAARCDWIEGRVAHDQARYNEAEALLARAREVFDKTGLPLEAARCARELAHNDILSERNKPLLVLDRLRDVFAAEKCVLDVTLCDYHKADALWRSTKFVEALTPAQLARRNALGAGAKFLAAWSDRSLGVVYRHLSRFEEALLTLQRARDYFYQKGIWTDVSACDINLGSAYYILNRFDEALTAYQEAADLCSGQGRLARLAVIYVNMGLVCIKQGQFSHALDRYHRALQIAESKQLTMLASASHAGLGICYRELGQFSHALEHLGLAKQVYIQHNLPESIILCDIELAGLYLVLGKTAQAAACLQQAHIGAAEGNLDSLVAICDRLEAQVTAETGTKTAVRTLLQNARALFLKHEQTVDAALCDLTEGELNLVWNKVATARACFGRARKTLAPGFPDQAWRAEYGLGRCAAAAGRRPAALNHYLEAVRTISISRAALATEHLGNAFFERRQPVFDEALALAVQLGDGESALEIVEASKARTFLTLLQQRNWKLRNRQADPYVAGLVAREQQLRYQLAALRGRMAVQASSESPELLRSPRELETISAAALQDLNALSQTYEAVVSQLRLAVTGLAGASTPAPFAQDAFRRAAGRAFGAQWAALDYYLSAEDLTLLVVHPDRVDIVRHKLSAFDRATLEDCTSSEPDLRALIYRGTLHGQPVDSPGFKYLRHLYRLLVPPDLAAHNLIVAPHGPLHSLPFQALLDGETYLVEQHTLTCTPSLAVFQHLVRTPDWTGIANPLVLGVSEFGDRARPLPGALAEVDQLCNLFHGQGQYWREGEATRQRLVDLDTTGELARFDLVHFATHALLDARAPHQSHVLLADGALSALDIADLTLNAKLVVLSACKTALGQGGRGDEIVGLVRSFFYAGAHGLLTTLWPVEDGSMPELVGRFYRHWVGDTNAAEALRQAQIELLRAGKPPYVWAPLVLMGQP